VSKIPVEDSDGSLDVLSWYEELSSGYDELYGEEQSRKYIRIFKELSLRSYLMNKKQVILDLGCGTGGLIKFLYREFRNVLSIYYVGLDLSPLMCFLSKEQIDRIGVLGDVVAGDIFRPPLRTGVANAVFSITVLTCKDHLEEVVPNLTKLLKDSGLLCCTILCSDPSRHKHYSELCETSASLSRWEVLCIIK